MPLLLYVLLETTRGGQSLVRRLVSDSEGAAAVLMLVLVMLAMAGVIFSVLLLIQHFGG